MAQKLSHFIFADIIITVSLVLIIEGCSLINNTVKYQQAPLKPVSGQNPYSISINSKTTISYLLYLPESYGKDKNAKWPLILFLHGMGERGNDLGLLKKHPLPKILDEQKDFPCIVVSPQLPLEKNLWDDYIGPLKDLLDQIKVNYAVDIKRVYMTGLSMGGAGTWNFALRYPEYFAAIVPIAGAYKFRSKEVPENICAIKDLPAWAFHGGKDYVVEAWQTEILVDALKKCGSNIRYTFYPDADHPQTWIKAYADPELYKWLLNQTLK